MSAAGSIKALITKAAKELHRRNRDVWDKFGDILEACESTAKQSSAEGEPDIMDEFSTHWKNHGYEDVVNEAHKEVSEASDTEFEAREEHEVELRTNVHLADVPQSSDKTVACRSSSAKRAARLMVVEALTHNFNTKADQLLTIFLDSGSQHSFISKETAESLALQLKNPRDITAITLGGHEHTERSYQVKIVLQNPATGTPVKLKLWTSTYITAVPEITEVRLNALQEAAYQRHGRCRHPHRDGLLLECVRSQPQPQTPIWLSPVPDQRRFFRKLGPVLSGPNTAVTQVTTDPIRQHDSERETDDIVRKLFTLDSAELDDDRDTVNTEIIQQYYDTVKVIKGMMHVQFPWKPNHPFLLTHLLHYVGLKANIGNFMSIRSYGASAAGPLTSNWKPESLRRLPKTSPVALRCITFRIRLSSKTTAALRRYTSCSTLRAT
ncbi:unnamed protein product [Heligmosomoides polygyrus]|uniref:DUF1758 domain-containing protein n=1 Tax=Heligmosomoides polygyrus TaxID=6339 RepID=A0A183GC30_HELPZ|nr:unnamed protein product [Heligmosomoides polygyrus]